MSDVRGELDGETVTLRSASGDVILQPERQGEQVRIRDSADGERGTCQRE